MHGRIAEPARMAAALLVLCALAALALACAPRAAAAAGEGDGPSLSTAVLREMNRARARHDRPPLRPLSTLARPARAHSGYLLGRGELSHESRDGSPFWTRLVAAGFPRRHAMGENLAMLYGCDAAAARLAVRLWMESPPHRANLLSRRFRWAGLGAASDEDCATTVITADYGG
jgi:uncharacterized protein YkwD